MWPSIEDAQCRIEKVPTDVFFGFEGESPAEREVRLAMAKGVCERCRARQVCLDSAIHNDEQGIWGGTTENERLRSVEMAPKNEHDVVVDEWIDVASMDGVTFRKTRQPLNRRWQVVVDGSIKHEHSFEDEGWITWNRHIEARMRSN